VLFNSYVFCLLFLPVVLAGWWLLPGSRARLGFLTLASYLFYGWWDWRFVPLMLASTTADFVAGSAIDRSNDPRYRRLVLVLLLAFNLGILALFKYYDFFAGSLNGLGRLLGAPLDLPLLHLVLPIGISFYTFNSISYTIDIYRGVLRPARSLLEFSTFVAMFPHLVAGPIVRYADLAPQFSRLPARADRAGWVMGCWFFVLGMAKKVLVADLLAAHLVTPLWHQAATLDAGEAWLAVLAYTMQIYFDFSGYSDMAIGLAFLLGFRFPQNFDAPYQSANIGEFWRRWHMSLSFWLRDYLYIPLGGSHGSRARTAGNLLLVMLLGGLWHGAAWTFVVWGLYHGALLAGHALFARRGWVPRARPVAVGCTLLAVMVGWVFFRAASLAEAWQVLGAMSGIRGGTGGNLGLVGGPFAYGLLLAALGIAWGVPDTWRLALPRRPVWGVALAALLVLCLLRFATPSPFLYFQF
jgi:alginate O-acetyltransferase complex protein AlgI